MNQNLSMKNIFIVIILTTSIFSCKKESNTYCYECKNISPSAGYAEFGCMSESDWNNQVVSFYPNGNNMTPSEKAANCRRK